MSGKEAEYFRMLAHLAPPNAPAHDLGDVLAAREIYDSAIGEGMSAAEILTPGISRLFGMAHVYFNDPSESQPLLRGYAQGLAGWLLRTENQILIAKQSDLIVSVLRETSRLYVKIGLVHGSAGTSAGQTAPDYDWGRTGKARIAEGLRRADEIGFPHPFDSTALGSMTDFEQYTCLTGYGLGFISHLSMKGLPLSEREFQEEIAQTHPEAFTGTCTNLLQAYDALH